MPSMKIASIDSVRCVFFLTVCFSQKCSVHARSGSRWSCPCPTTPHFLHSSTLRDSCSIRGPLDVVGWKNTSNCIVRRLLRHSLAPSMWSSSTTPKCFMWDAWWNEKSTRTVLSAVILVRNTSHSHSCIHTQSCTHAHSCTSTLCSADTCIHISSDCAASVLTFVECNSSLRDCDVCCLSVICFCKGVDLDMSVFPSLAGLEDEQLVLVGYPVCMAAQCVCARGPQNARRNRAPPSHHCSFHLLHIPHIPHIPHVHLLSCAID